MSASEKNVPAHSASDELDHESQIHDIISAKEKQAARSGICFSCAINEQAVCKADDKAPKVRACEYDTMNAKEKQATQD